jgi:hypothetical protein
MAGALSLDTNLFIDGTKIESVANKYTFVWKKNPSRNGRPKYLAQIPCFILKMQETLRHPSAPYGKAVHRYHLRRLLGKLKRLQKEAASSFSSMGKATARRHAAKAVEKAKDFPA